MPLALTVGGVVTIVVRATGAIRTHPAFGPHSNLDPISITAPPDGFEFAVKTRTITAWTRCSRARTP